MQLPADFLNLCGYLYQKEFAFTSPNSSAYLKAHRAALRSGLDTEICETLLIGVRACEWKKNSQDREFYFRASQESVRIWRYTKLAPKYLKQRQEYSTNQFEYIESLIMLGYALACGVSKVQRAHWYPLAPALETILLIRKSRDVQYDPQKQIVNSVRRRLQRLQTKHGGRLPTDDAKNCFDQVHATVFL